MDKNTFIQLAKDAYGLTLLFPSREPLRYKIREIASDILASFIIKDKDFLGDLKARLELIDSFFEIALSQDWTSPARISEVREEYSRAGLSLLEKEEAPCGTVFGADAKNEKITNFVIIENNSGDGVPGLPPLGLINRVPIQKPMIALETVAAAEEEPESIFNENLENAAGDDGGQAAAPLTGSQISRQNRILEFLKERGGAQVWEIQKIFPKVSKRTIRRDFHSMLEQGLIERTGERNMTAYKLKIILS